MAKMLIAFGYRDNVAKTEIDPGLDTGRQFTNQRKFSGLALKAKVPIRFFNELDDLKKELKCQGTEVEQTHDDLIVKEKAKDPRPFVGLTAANYVLQYRDKKLSAIDPTIPCTKLVLSADVLYNKLAQGNLGNCSYVSVLAMLFYSSLFYECEFWKLILEPEGPCGNYTDITEKPDCINSIKRLLQVKPITDDPVDYYQGDEPDETLKPNEVSGGGSDEGSDESEYTTSDYDSDTDDTDYNSDDRSDEGSGKYPKAPEMENTNRVFGFQSVPDIGIEFRKISEYVIGEYKVLFVDSDPANDFKQSGKVKDIYNSTTDDRVSSFNTPQIYHTKELPAEYQPAGFFLTVKIFTGKPNNIGRHSVTLVRLPYIKDSKAVFALHIGHPGYDSKVAPALLPVDEDFLLGVTNMNTKTDRVYYYDYEQGVIKLEILDEPTDATTAEDKVVTKNPYPYSRFVFTRESFNAPMGVYVKPMQSTRPPTTVNTNPTRRQSIAGGAEQRSSKSLGVLTAAFLALYGATCTFMA